MRRMQIINGMRRMGTENGTRRMSDVNEAEVLDTQSVEDKEVSEVTTEVTAEENGAN